MSLITLAYNIPVGVRRAQDELARIAAIDLTLGELDLLQMSVFDDSVFESAGRVIRQVTLEPNAQGEVSFPTDQAKVDATVGLYGGQLDLNVPSNVARVPPLVEGVTPLDFGGLSVQGLVEWFRADMGITEDVAHLVSAWANKAPGFPGNLTSAGALRPFHSESDVNWLTRMALTFDGANRMDSDLAALAWNFLHSGSGMTVIVAARPTAAVTPQVMLSTAQIATTNRGNNLWYDGAAGLWHLQVGNGAALAIDATTAVATPPSTKQLVVARFLEGRPGNEWALQANGAGVSGNTAAAPNVGDAQATLRVGASAVTGTNPITTTLPEIVVYGSYLSDDDLAELIAGYYVPRYGTFP